MNNIVIIYHTGYGHTKLQTVAIDRGVPCIGNIETVEMYGRRVAEITLQFVRGRAQP
jgi:hypothetical protein